jgi:hypothetical protein
MNLADEPEGSLSPKKLAKILTLHKAWIDAKKGGRRANLAGSNLAGSNLAGSNLAGSNLAGSNLKGANLAGANLAGANLKEANLDRANLAGANLDRAYLAGANLEGANLEGASLERASLDRANLRGVDLGGAVLKGAFLFGAAGLPENAAFTRSVAAYCLKVGERLQMADWNSPCGTAHCIGGWIVVLAGAEGERLKTLNGTPTAAALLCPSLSHLFFETKPERREFVLSELRRIAAGEPATPAHA